MWYTGGVVGELEEWYVHFPMSAARFLFRNGEFSPIRSARHRANLPHILHAKFLRFGSVRVFQSPIVRFGSLRLFSYKYYWYETAVCVED